MILLLTTHCELPCSFWQLYSPVFFRCLLSYSIIFRKFRTENLFESLGRLFSFHYQCLRGNSHQSLFCIFHSKWNRDQQLNSQQLSYRVRWKKAEEYNDQDKYSNLTCLENYNDGILFTKIPPRNGVWKKKAFTMIWN